MLWLFFLLMFIIAILEFLDEITTQVDLKRFGIDAESNKIIRILEEKEGEKGVFLYKLLSIIGFGVIGYFIYLIDPIYFYGLASIVIALYTGVVIHNFKLEIQK
ncbi:hypothetical protein HOD83_00305 [Candidatus Woesearchaeota archaeon]|jgi:hypothetical protein|nr:hypothetical protein [Candidatus Woesearchaeota archaeon]MBT4114639.1 hypothetical protein [Candidatus Woesearchaeota archaeon]MBT4248019.1 hypothetical protein [Candidatus Woesearchaeota archaeon]